MMKIDFLMKLQEYIDACEEVDRIKYNLIKKKMLEKRIALLKSELCSCDIFMFIDCISAFYIAHNLLKSSSNVTISNNISTVTIDNTTTITCYYDSARREKVIQIVEQNYIFHVSQTHNVLNSKLTKTFNKIVEISKEILLDFIRTAMMEDKNGTA